MTRPFRDPIIYPGASIETVTRRPTVRRQPQWIRIYHRPTCVIGGERMPLSTWGRTTSDGIGWECRDHAQGESA